MHIPVGKKVLSVLGYSQSCTLSHFLQGVLPREKSRSSPDWPTGPIQYWNAIANGRIQNAEMNHDREYHLQRHWTVLYHGYDSVLDTARRPGSTSAAFTPEKRAYNSTNRRSSIGASSSTTNTSTTSSHKPLVDATGLRQFPFECGAKVVVWNTPTLQAMGVTHLVGQQGVVYQTPQTRHSKFYAIMFQDKKIHLVPEESLVHANQKVPAGALAMPLSSSTTTTTTTSANPYQVQHSFQLHQLLQQQNREVQILQHQYAEAQRVKNTALLAELQLSLTNLNQTHMIQIQNLKQQQMLELTSTMPRPSGN